METDFKLEGKKLLLRALTAMVKKVESCEDLTACVEYRGEDIVDVYNALVADDGLKQPYDEQVEKLVEEFLNSLIDDGAGA